MLYIVIFFFVLFIYLRKNNKRLIDLKTTDLWNLSGYTVKYSLIFYCVDFACLLFCFFFMREQFNAVLDSFYNHIIESERVECLNSWGLLIFWVHCLPLDNGDIPFVISGCSFVKQYTDNEYFIQCTNDLCHYLVHKYILFFDYCLDKMDPTHDHTVDNMTYIEHRRRFLFLSFIYFLPFYFSILLLYRYVFVKKKKNI